MINCKIELKLKWTKYFVLSAAVNDNANDNNNANSIIFTIKDTKLCFSVVTLSAREKQKYQNFLANNLEYQINGYKTKSESENTTNGYRDLLELKLLESIYYLF